MKKYLLTLLIPILGFMMLVPQASRAEETATAQAWYKANDLLTRPIDQVNDVLKWTVRTVFDHTVEFWKTVNVYGDSTFYNPVYVEDGLRAKNVTIKGDTILGDNSLDDTVVAGKIARPGGPIWIYDDLRVQGNLELVTESIGSSEIADGSITDADLQDDYQTAYAATIVVSPIGTGPQNGTYLRQIINGINDASASKPYLVKVEPGTYDNSDGSPIEMKPYVDLEGSGEGVTVITGNSDSYGVIDAESNMEIRDLTIQADGSGTDVYGVNIDSGKTAALKDVTIEISNGTDYLVGIICTNARVETDNVTISLEGSAGDYTYGINMINCTNNALFGLDISASGASNDNIGILTDDAVTVEQSTIAVSGGINAYGIRSYSNGASLVSVVISAASASTTNTALDCTTDSAIVDRSSLAGSTASINTSGTAQVSASKLSGPITGSGSYTCVSSYNGSYISLDATCSDV